MSSFDAGLRLIFKASIDIANPIKSEAKCAVSVKIAIELEIYPPISYTIIKNTETQVASLSCLMALL